MFEKSAVCEAGIFFALFCEVGLLVVIKKLFGLLYHVDEKNSVCELIIQFYKSDSCSIF